MPATEHATVPHPHSTSRENPPAPRRPVVEPLRPLPPSNLIPDPPKPKEKTSEPESKSPHVESKPVSRPPPTPKESEPEEKNAPTRSLIDMDTFSQILELDEDEETHDFSRPMVWEYFEQAEKTFREMDDAVEKKDLPSLSSLGHFLKGSSAALGLSRVQNSCEKIQHSGAQRDEEANKNLTPEEALKSIQKLLKQVKVDYHEAQTWLKGFFDEEVEA